MQEKKPVIWKNTPLRMGQYIGDMLMENLCLYLKYRIVPCINRWFILIVLPVSFVTSMANKARCNPLSGENITKVYYS